jgi:hypothetical protein
MHENRRLKIDYLHEFEADLKKALARESGAQGDSLMKKPKVENLVTLSFKDPIQHVLMHSFIQSE